MGHPNICEPQFRKSNQVFGPKNACCPSSGFIDNQIACQKYEVDNISIWEPPKMSSVSRPRVSVDVVKCPAVDSKLGTHSYELQLGL